MTRALTLAASLAASPAAALTCAPVDPVSSYLSADAAPEDYVVLLGTLAFDDRALAPPAGGPPAAPPDAPLPPVPARLDGLMLAADGFTRPAALDLVLEPTCAGPWCGWISSGEDRLVFARAAGGRLVVEVGPCGGWVFEAPAEAALAALAACARGEACGP